MTGASSWELRIIDNKSFRKRWGAFPGIKNFSENEKPTSNVRLTRVLLFLAVLSRIKNSRLAPLLDLNQRPSD